MYAGKVTMNQLHVFMQDSFQLVTQGLVNMVLFHNNLTFLILAILTSCHDFMWFKAAARKSEL